MISVEEITSAGRFAIWTEQEGVSPDASSLLTHRMAMRVLPIYWDAVADVGRAGPFDAAIMPVLQTNLTAGVAVFHGRPPATFPDLERAVAAIRTTAPDESISGDGPPEYALDILHGSRIAELSLKGEDDAVEAVKLASEVSMAGPDFSDAILVALRVDCTLLDDLGRLFKTPLWHTIPAAAEAAWDAVVEGTDLRATPQWAFWIEWYQRALDGREDRWDLLREIALLDKDADGADLWENPVRLAAEIARLEGEYAARGAGDGDALAAAEKLLHAALADFKFDTARKLLTMRPFAEDLAVIKDKDQRDGFLNDAAGMLENMERLAEGLRREGTAMQGAGLVSVELEGLMEEFSRARQLETLNVGKIVKFGEFLQSAVLDEATRAEFGSLATKRLEDIVDELLALVRRYFSRSLLRFAPLETLELEEGTKPSKYLDELRQVLRDMRDADGSGGLTPLAREDVAVLASIADEIDRVMRAEASATGITKTKFRREVNYKLALLTVSIALYAKRARELGGTLDETFDVLVTQMGRAVVLNEFWKLVKKMIGLE